MSASTASACANCGLSLDEHEGGFVHSHNGAKVCPMLSGVATPSPPPSFPELVAQLVELTDQRQHIADRIMEVEDLLTAAMRGADVWYVEVPGLPPIKRHGGKKRSSWDHEAVFTTLRLLAREPRHRKMADPEAGEIESPEEAVARHIKECAYVAYWRAGDLKARGVQPDQFCEVSYGRQTIEVIR